MKTARGNYPNGSIKHRRFAIRPRLAYFPRVRSPLRGLYQPPRRLSLGLHLRRALQRPTWPPRGRRRKAPNVAGAGWRFAPEKSRLRGDEYRPRARARACVHDALPSQNYGQRRLNLSAPNADRNYRSFTLETGGEILNGNRCGVPEVVICWLGCGKSYYCSRKW